MVSHSRIIMKKIIFELSKLSVSPPENLEMVISYFSSKDKITFFSWKMFDINLDRNRQPVFNNTFNIIDAKKFINRELLFLKLLKKYNVSFEYIKIIPDDLPVYFYQIKNKSASVFSKNVENFFRQFYPQTKVFLFTDFIKNKKLQKLYDKIFEDVYKNRYFDKIELDKEVKLRSNKDIAARAFALFAAESAILYELSKKTFPNLILLAGERSLNTYKYEFYKCPKNRPVLPKLFVI